jgi:hypothetical protein
MLLLVLEVKRSTLDVVSRFRSPSLYASFATAV